MPFYRECRPGKTKAGPSVRRNFGDGSLETRKANRRHILATCHCEGAKNCTANLQTCMTSCIHTHRGTCPMRDLTLGRACTNRARRASCQLWSLCIKQTTTSCLERHSDLLHNSASNIGGLFIYGLFTDSSRKRSWPAVRFLVSAGRDQNGAWRTASLRAVVRVQHLPKMNCDCKPLANTFSGLICWPTTYMSPFWQTNPHTRKRKE